MPFTPPPPRLADGRKSVGQRPLTKRERDELVARYRRHRTMKVVWVLALIFVPVGFLAILAVTPLGPGIGIFLMFAGLILIGFVAISAWEALKEIPELEISAKATEVELFKEATGAVVTEVIASSGEVFSVDGRRSEKRTYVEVIAPVFPSSTVAGPGESRSLTGEEKRDLQRKLKAVRKEAGKLLYLPSFSLILGLLFLLVHKALPGKALGLFFLATSMPSVWKGIKTLANAKRIKRDLDKGMIQGLERGEVLLHSQLDWTTNGYPAAWRNSPLSE